MADHTYRYLSALVSQGSFSQAARYLDISQPSLSQFIQRLEAEAGTELIDRTSRPLRLTAAGDCFLQTERRIEQLRDLRTKEIADIGAGIRGHVRLGVSQYRSSYFLPLVLPRFRSLFPAIDITLVEATNDALETCAADGTTDVSIVLAPVLNNELTYTALYDEKILIATATDSALAKSVPETKAEFDKLDFSRLDAEPFITLRRGQKFHRLFWNLSSRCSVSPRIVLESESPIAALMLASAGLGATFVTETLARRCPTAQPVRFFEIAPLVPPRQVVAARRKDTYLSKAAQSLIDVMHTVGEREFRHG